jgi:glycosyltransferase involved in cell wall biosynthesis
MRIVILAPAKSTHTIKWLRHLVASGHDVHVITATAHYIPDVQIPGAHYHMLRGPLKTAFVAGVASIRRIVRDVEPAIVHAHYASSYGTLGRLSRFRPFILSVWGSDVFDFPNRSPLHYALIRANLRAADCLCSTSEVMAEQVRQLVSRPDSVEVVPFGVDTEVFRPDSSLQDPNAFVVGTVKSLEPVYGIDILIRAFALARSVAARECRSLSATMRLLIVGDGSQRSKLERLARVLGVYGATEFLGCIPNEQVPSVLNRLSIYAALSRQESFGVAVAEASACGLPVLVSRVGGMPEVVDDGVTGIVVEKENVRAAANAILRSMRAPSMRKRMGDAGRRSVLKKYNWSENAARMEHIYAKVGEFSGRKGSSFRSRISQPW